MNLNPTGMSIIEAERPVIQLTRSWGDWDSVSLYLDRCQIDTPRELIETTWEHVKLLRNHIGKVVDFGAGDGRFSEIGEYEEYVGFEIDEKRCNSKRLPENATLLNRCAFSDEIYDADLCIGNPPFVRNQDLPSGWRQHASEVLCSRTGVSISGLANAWQYFFLLALDSVKNSGLCALIIPYEWVSRPSVRGLREYVRKQQWHVTVYRLSDTRFDNVLTTSSITIIDKAKRDGVWEYFRETANGGFDQLNSLNGSDTGILEYLHRKDIPIGIPHAMRGLSPGTQKALTLTEGQRMRNGLLIGRDVVPCVTSLRHLTNGIRELDDATFWRFFCNNGQKCWLIRTDGKLSPVLRLYLDSVPFEDYQTATCLKREEWWNFNMPPIPQILFAQSFRKEFPKRVRNSIKARAVGGVCGIYNLLEDHLSLILSGFGGMDLRKKVLAHSNDFRKIEINQLNSLLHQEFGVLRGNE